MITNNTSVGIAASLAAFAFSTSAVAQVAVGSDESFGGSAMHATAHGATALASSYSAKVAANGFEFTPALGSQAPRSYPWRFELETVRRGGTLAHEASASSESPVAVKGLRADVLRAPGLVERYEALEAGVEQSFVFDSLPGSGDLVVRGRVVTDLIARCGSGADAIHFESPYGGVELTGIVGIDANGWRVPGSMSWDGTHLELTLSGSFVDRAAFPLVLDPLIGSSGGVALSSHDNRNPQVAYSGHTNRFLAVWERHLSATEVEIRGRLRTNSNSAATSIFVIASGPLRRTDPQVCGIGDNDHFVVAWQEGPSQFGPFDIYACTVDGLTGSVVNTANVTVLPGAPLPIATSYSEIRPALAGDPDGTIGRVVIAYEMPGTGIATRSTPVSSGGAMAWTLVPQLVVNDADASRPRLSQSGADHQALVYETRSGTIEYVEAVRIDGTGIPSGQVAAFLVGESLRNPVIDGDGTDFRVLMEREMALGDHDIFCGTIAWDAAGNKTQGTSLRPVATTAGVNERNPAIAFVGPKYLTGWSQRASAFAYDACVRAMGVDGNCTDCGPVITLPGTRATQYQLAIGARAESTSPSDQALVLWTSSELSPTAPLGDVRGQIFDAMQGSVGVEFGSGCGTPTGLFAGSGTFAIGSDDFVLEASSTNSQTQLCLFNFGFTQQTIACGCTVVVPDIIEVVLMVGGSASLPLPLPCDTSLSGASFYLQTAALNLSSQSGPCSLLRSASFSTPEQWTIGY